MKLKKKIMIEATSDRVWQYVGSPDMWPFFHVKAGECTRVGSRDDGVGALYDIEFRRGSRTSLTRCEIIESRIGRSITLRSTLPEPNRRTGRLTSADITYELGDLGGKTRVTETTDFPSAPIPLLLRPLVWFLMRFGTPSGETTLMRLKGLVEEEDCKMMNAEG